MSEDLKKIEHKIDRIISICAQLQKENLSLKKRTAELLAERSQLLEKNTMTRNRVEHMINRLKNYINEN